MHALSDAVRQQIAKLRAQGKTVRQIAAELGISKTAVGEHVQGKTYEPQPKPQNTRTDDFGKDSGSIEMKATRICTLDQMIEHCKIDLDTWEVERFLCNKWEVGAADKRDGKLRGIVVEPLFQVKVWLKRRRDVEFAKARIEKLIEDAKRLAPKFPHIVRMRSRDTDGVWIEPSLYDHHFGALIWAKETGHEDYDSTIARRCWGDALSSLLDRAEPYKAEGAVFPLGHDLVNANNRQGTTERGTQQSMDTRYERVFDIAADASKWAIDQMVARGLRVHVPIVKGNHDPQVVWHLGRELEIYYQNNPRVTIDNRPTKRKWWEHGVNMLMFTHGDTGKLPDYGKTMAAENPEMWGRTKWREAHTGDKHHKEMIEQPGAIVRILSSLRPLCAWSAEQMYGAIRAAELFAWSKTEGLIGQTHYSILPGQLRAIGDK